MQLFWDILRGVTATAAVLTVGVCLSTWMRPMPLGQRIRLSALSALIGTLGVADVTRLGEPPAAVWRLVSDPLIIGAALYGGWMLRGELPPPRSRRFQRPLIESQVGDRKLNAVVVIGYTAIGATLILQPDRYINTPSYANLLAVLPGWAWGAIYLMVAAALGLTVHVRYRRAAVVTAYTAAVALTATWFVAFIVRWLTDNGTTVVNVVSWGTYLILVVFSAIAQVDWGERVVTSRDTQPQEQVAGDDLPT